MRIRRIEPGDVEAVVGLVHDLVVYEREPQECHLDFAWTVLDPATWPLRVYFV